MVIPRDALPRGKCRGSHGRGDDRLSYPIPMLRGVRPGEGGQPLGIRQESAAGEPFRRRRHGGWRSLTTCWLRPDLPKGSRRTMEASEIWALAGLAASLKTGERSPEFRRRLLEGAQEPGA